MSGDTLYTMLDHSSGDILNCI